MPAPDCVFCAIVAGATPAHIVLDRPETLAFLDQRPVFPGHVLVIPKTHYETLADLPTKAIPNLFEAVQDLSRAVQAAAKADGTFVANNNTVSKSVPHLHVHVVPRKRKDGLRGFFWPRQKYAGDDEMDQIAAEIRTALDP